MVPIDAAGAINAVGSQDSRTLGDLHSIFGGDHPTEETLLLISSGIGSLRNFFLKHHRSDTARNAAAVRQLELTEPRPEQANAPAAEGPTRADIPT